MKAAVGERPLHRTPPSPGRPCRLRRTRRRLRRASGSSAPGSQRSAEAPSATSSPPCQAPAPALRDPGRTEQLGVFPAYATTCGRTLVDRWLYLPKSWTEDRERCRAAKVPDDRELATKDEPSRRMVLRAVTSPMPITWVSADAPTGRRAASAGCCSRASATCCPCPSPSPSPSSPQAVPASTTCLCRLKPRS
ncbi:transposase [Streptomyces sp. P9-A4]